MSSRSDSHHGSGLTDSDGLPVRAGVAPGHPAVGRTLGGLRASLGAVVLAPVYAMYTRRLRVLVRASQPPHHVAVILDGNRRWANLAGMREPGAGHRRGADKLSQLIAWCSELRIAELTVWALSTENLSRAKDEVAALTEILSEELGLLAERAATRGAPIRIRVFGRLDDLPTDLAETARRVQAETRDNDGMCLNVALGYSGRDELVDAMRGLVRSLAKQGVPADELAERVDAAAIRRHLYTADHTDPDLIIRTSGEMRLSGFLPWQSSHSEFYFTDVYWPAFRELDFLRAVRTFQQRERRFGR
jgi:short-chain Z-isoprenyl diphosphate synthase